MAPTALDAPVTLVFGSEALLAERAVAAIVGDARARDAEVDVTEVAGAELTAPALVEHTSPSLFSSARVLIVHDLQDVADPVGDALLAYAGAPVDDVRVVLVHPGGQKGKRLLDALRKAGVQRVTCEKLTKPNEQVEFVSGEVAARGGRIDQRAARALVEAVGGDLRALAAAASQLSADADGRAITSAVVATYFDGHAEVKSWAVTDRAVEGKVGPALEHLRWALETGTAPVLITGALATSLRTLVKLNNVQGRGRDADVAAAVGVPPWKLKILRGQLRGWSPDGLSRAVQSVAEADLRVKGESNDPALALTRAIVDIAEARSAG